MRLYLALLATAVLFACEYKVTSYPTPQPKTLTGCDMGEVTLRVRWAASIEEVAAVCRKHSITLGCTERVEIINGERVAFITTMKPKDFDDVPLLAVLGHEVCHTLGGTHE